LFDHLEFDKWVERGEAPGIPSSLKLYKEVLELGFKAILLTGRSEGHRGVTVDNLNKQGFHDWDKLILRYTWHISFKPFATIHTNLLLCNKPTVISPIMTTMVRSRLL
jgi:hypothetical protein